MPQSIPSRATFEQFYASNKPALVRYAQHVLRDRPCDAEDLVQEAFVRAHRCFLEAGDCELPATSWLFTVVRNAAIDEYRKTSRLIPSDEADEQTGGEDPADIASSRAEIRAVVADVIALPVRQRRALIAHAVEGIPHRELARRAGTSEGSSKALVNRARDSLQLAREQRVAA